MIDKGIFRSILGPLNWMILAVIWLVLGKDGCGRYVSWKEERKKKCEYMRLIRDSENSDRLLATWRSVWESLPREEWEREWETLPMERRLDGYEDDKVFCRIFCDNYYETKLKAEKNRKGNFFWKKAFLAGICIGVALFLLWLFRTWGEVAGHHDEIIWMSGLFLLGIMLLSFILVKWVDIKKYQETWARHSITQRTLELEMLLFICQREPYHRSARKNVFFARSIEIWKGNLGKFGDNIENKEKGLTDGLNDLKSWVRT